MGNVNFGAAERFDMKILHGGLDTINVPDALRFSNADAQGELPLRRPESV